MVPFTIEPGLRGVGTGPDLASISKSTLQVEAANAHAHRTNQIATHAASAVFLSGPRC